MVDWGRHDCSHFKAASALKNCREGWTEGLMGGLFD
jgi:hypothetical protein